MSGYRTRQTMPAVSTMAPNILSLQEDCTINDGTGGFDEHIGNLKKDDIPFESNGKSLRPCWAGTRQDNFSSSEEDGFHGEDTASHGLETLVKPGMLPKLDLRAYTAKLGSDVKDMLDPDFAHADTKEEYRAKVQLKPGMWYGLTRRVLGESNEKKNEVVKLKNEVVRLQKDLHARQDEIDILGDLFTENANLKINISDLEAKLQQKRDAIRQQDQKYDEAAILNTDLSKKLETANTLNWKLQVALDECQKKQASRGRTRRHESESFSPDCREGRRRPLREDSESHSRDRCQRREHTVPTQRTDTHSQNSPRRNESPKLQPPFMRDELPNPPVIWKEVRTPEGKVYYFNALTKLAQWDKPLELQTPQERTVSGYATVKGDPVEASDMRSRPAHAVTTTKAAQHEVHGTKFVSTGTVDAGVRDRLRPIQLHPPAKFAPAKATSVNSTPARSLSFMRYAAGRQAVAKPRPAKSTSEKPITAQLEVAEKHQNSVNRDASVWTSKNKNIQALEASPRGSNLKTHLHPPTSTTHSDSRNYCSTFRDSITKPHQYLSPSTAAECPISYQEQSQQQHDADFAMATQLQEEEMQAATRTRRQGGRGR